MQPLNLAPEILHSNVWRFLVFIKKRKDRIIHGPLERQHYILRNADFIGDAIVMKPRLAPALFAKLPKLIARRDQKNNRRFKLIQFLQRWQDLLIEKRIGVLVIRKTQISHHLLHDLSSILRR